MSATQIFCIFRFLFLCYTMHSLVKCVSFVLHLFRLFSFFLLGEIAFIIDSNMPKYHSYNNNNNNKKNISCCCCYKHTLTLHRADTSTICQYLLLSKRVWYYIWHDRVECTHNAGNDIFIIIRKWME